MITQSLTPRTSTNRIENLHVLMWLLKDFSWCSSWHWLGILTIIPTFAITAKIAWDSRKNTPDLVHNVAVCFWICANVTWMTGEFFYEDHTRSYAKVFFYSGMVFLMAYYAHAAKKKVASWLMA